jgi:hypothetical protein
MRTSRPASLLRLAAALLFLGFVAEQAPHRVHHLFDPVEAQAECDFAVAGERLPGLAMAVECPPAIVSWGLVAPGAPAAAPVGPALIPGRPRAPPAVAS